MGMSLRNNALAALQRNRGTVPGVTTGHVFGLNAAVGATAETVWDSGGRFAYPTVAETLRVKAGGDAADTAAGAGARSIEVTFLDADFVEQVEVLATAGVSASAETSVTAIRLIGARVLTSGAYHTANTAAVTIEHTTSGLVMGLISTTGRTQSGMYTVPAAHTAYITKMDVMVSLSQQATVSLLIAEAANIIAAPFGSAHQHVWQATDFAGAMAQQFDSYLVVPEKSDIEITSVRTEAADAAVSALLCYLLVADGALG